jgi:hypothetical protein
VTKPIKVGHERPSEKWDKTNANEPKVFATFFFDWRNADI